MDFSPGGTGVGILAVEFQFVVEQGFFFSGRQAAIEQVALFHVANALKNLAAIRKFKLGQFQQDFSLTRGLKLRLIQNCSNGKYVVKASKARRELIWKRRLKSDTP